MQPAELREAPHEVSHLRAAPLLAAAAEEARDVNMATPECVLREGSAELTQLGVLH